MIYDTLRSQTEPAATAKVNALEFHARCGEVPANDYDVTLVQDLDNVFIMASVRIMDPDTALIRTFG